MQHLESGSQKVYRAKAMRSAAILSSAVLAALFQAGCAGPPPSAYPDLAIREVERVRPPPAPVATPPRVATPAQLAQIADLLGQARSAHAAFLEAEPGLRRVIAAARGASRGSEGWARAQVALAQLQSHRSQTMIPLADLDRLYVETITAGVALPSVADAQAEAETMVATETRVISALGQDIR